VGVGQAGNRPTLVSGYELVLHSEAWVEASRSVVANRLQLWDQVVVDKIWAGAIDIPHQNATYSKPTNPFPSNMPALPPLAVVSPGTSALNVTASTPIANPGSYGAVSVDNAVTWKLSTGVYHLASLHLENDAHIEVQGPVQIRIAGRMDGLDRTRILPAANVTLTAGDLRIEVSGRNGSSGSLSDSPKSAQFGNDATINGLILAPNGTLQFGARAILTGGYSAQDIHFDNDAMVTYQSGVGPSPCLEPCNDNLPCTVDACDVGTCTHTNAVEGTACEDGDPCTAADTCKSGVCIGGPGPSCNDGDSDTLDYCDSTSGCEHLPIAEDIPEGAIISPILDCAVTG
jgi:hypothetical protein